MHVIEGKKEGRIEVTEDEEEDVSSYYMTLRKGEDTGNWKIEHYMALCGELALEEATDLSSEYMMMMMMMIMNAHDTVLLERHPPWFDLTVCVHIKCPYGRWYFMGYSFR